MPKFLDLTDIGIARSRLGTAFTPTAVKTSSYAASASDAVLCDPSGGGFTVTLPSAPARGTRILVKRLDNSGTNTLTVTRSGSDVFNNSGGATSLQMSIPGETVELEYTSGVWVVMSHSFPKAGLDTRYVVKAPAAVADWYSLLDSNGAQALAIAPTTSAVNYWQLSNSATGGVLVQRAQGADSNVSIGVRTKGTGSFLLYGGPGDTIAQFTPTTSAVNYWQLSNSATGGVLVQRAQGADSNVSIGVRTKGTGSVLLYGGPGDTIAQFTPTTSAVNYWQLSNSAAGSNLLIRAQGADTDVSIGVRTKGAGSVLFYGGPGDVLAQFSPAASAVNYFRFDSAATGAAVKIQATGSDTDVSLNLVSKNAGTVQVNGVPIVATTVPDATNLTFGTTTGTRIGTSSTQKIGFWNTAPAVQPTAVADATDAASVITQLNSLLGKLRTIGIIAT